jgi:hypothetical protein
MEPGRNLVRARSFIWSVGYETAKSSCGGSVRGGADEANRTNQCAGHNGGARYLVGET